jgi:hypothetical protein
MTMTRVMDTVFVYILWFRSCTLKNEPEQSMISRELEVSSCCSSLLLFLIQSTKLEEVRRMQSSDEERGSMIISPDPIGVPKHRERERERERDQRKNKSIHH